MSTVENLGNTKTIRIGEESDQEVDNYSRKIAIIHNGGTIPLLGKEGSHEETGRHEIAGANQHTAIDAEVYEDEIYLLSRAPVAKVTNDLTKHAQNTLTRPRASAVADLTVLKQLIVVMFPYLLRF